LPGPEWVGFPDFKRELLFPLVAALVALALPTTLVSLAHVDLLSDRFFNVAFTTVRWDVSIQPRIDYLTHAGGLS
jgi:hypothetical protein